MSDSTNPRSNGGIAKAAKIRAAYNLNPNRCKMCEKPILCLAGSKLSDVRCKLFCNHKCAARFNNRGRKCKHAVQRTCRICNESFIHAPPDNTKSTCSACCEKRRQEISSRTKGSFTKGNKRALRDSARSALKHLGKKCIVCGYDKFVEACHIRPVKDFPDSSTWKEINDISNIVPLCPNCHWEFDRNLIVMNR